MMQGFLPLQCRGCNFQVQSTQEKIQQKLALTSITATHIQTQASQFAKLQKSQSAKTTFSRKMSLKNAKKANTKVADVANVCSAPSLNESTAEPKLMKSPSVKIFITYQQSSFVPPLVCQGPIIAQGQPAFRLQNRAILCQSISQQANSKPVRNQISTQNQNDIQKMDDHNIELTNLVKLSLKNSEKAKQYQHSQNQQLGVNCKPKKKVQFIHFQSKEITFNEKQNYSAFNSIALTKHNISIFQSGDINFSEASMAETNRNIEQFIQVLDQEKEQIKRVMKKNFTYFKQPDKKFFGVRTVNTIKSIDTPSEPSYVDLKYMQDMKKGFQNRLL